VTCPNCGRHVSSDWRGTLCPYCGAVLMSAMDMATAALALVFGAALMLMGRG